MNNDKQLTPEGETLTIDFIAEQLANTAVAYYDEDECFQSEHPVYVQAQSMLGYFLAQEAAARDKEIKEREQIIINKDLRIDEKISIIAKKDERIKKLEGELLRIMELCGVQHLNGESGALVAVSFILKERKELSAWKKEQIETFTPLLNYGQRPESGIKIGESIVTAAVAALKSQKEQAMRIAELEKERENFRTQAKHTAEKINGVELERDQVFDLLEEIEREGYLDIGLQAVDIKARILQLSSRENKKPISQWISIEDRVPNAGQPIYIYLDEEVIPGLYDYDGDDILLFWDANDNPTENVRLWMPRFVPAPPGFFTTKQPSGGITE